MKLNLRENIFKAHEILTTNILVEAKRGKIRTAQMFVADKKGGIAYVATDAAFVSKEMNKWFADIESLLSKVLYNDEALFYASMLHITFVNVHPFNDGNGRMARLIEKWFLSNYFGKKAWLIESERYYYENLQQYYKSLNRLGNDYASLNYSKALPFTEMLLKSLELQI